MTLRFEQAVRGRQLRFPLTVRDEALSEGCEAVYTGLRQTPDMDIPDEDVPALKEARVAAVFGSGHDDRPGRGFGRMGDVFGNP